jgi:hypothetical protein
MNESKAKNRAVLVVYEVGITQYTKLLLDDVFTVDTGSMIDEAYDVIVSPMLALSKQMMNGQPNAK